MPPDWPLDSGVDEGCDTPTEWFQDDDGDGAGGAVTLISCQQPSGYVAEGGDCIDSNAAIHPAALEVCDGADNNCDGIIDTDATDAAAWYPDEDGDGYGSVDGVLVTCEQPEGYIATGGDCDDADTGFHPGASETDCTDPADYNCDGSTGYADVDGDGFPACEECDDGDADINPDAAEVCDGADNDCDGESDESDAIDATTFYADADGDGYGDADSAHVACEPPEGYVGEATDCDDTDADTCPGCAEQESLSDCMTDGDGDGYGDSAPDGDAEPGGDCDDADAEQHPDAEEHCDGADNDCDGEIDEDDAVDVVTWYRDADGDGYGDPDVDDIDCQQPSGYVASNTDCDDDSATTWPGAASVDSATACMKDDDGDGYGDDGAPSGVTDGSDCDDADSSIHPSASEVVGDEVDQDCDGGEICYLDDDSDGYRPDTSSTKTSSDTDCTDSSEATDSAPSGDCDDADSSIHPSASELVGDEVDQDCDGGEICYLDDDSDGYRPDTSSTKTSSDTDCTDSSEATSSTPTGDCDDADSSIYPWAEEVCDDGIDQDCNGIVDNTCLEETWLSAADVEIVAMGGADFGGRAIELVDMDLDGSLDLLFTADQHDSNGSHSGSIYLIPGPVTDSGEVDDLMRAELMGEAKSDRAGWTVGAIADQDGDGYPEIFTSAHLNDDGGSSAGKAYVVYGPHSGVADLADAEASVAGTGASQYVGMYAQLSGDVSGDGTADLLVGAHGYSSNAGGFFIFEGPVSGAMTLADADSSVVGPSSSRYTGYAGSVEDFDGDGQVDLAASAPWNTNEAWIFLGPVSGALGQSDADITIDGESSGDHIGSLFTACDFNSDGHIDLATGADGESTGGTDAGAIYVFPGTESGPSEDYQLKIYSEQAEGELGDKGDDLGCGDVNGDGAADLLIGWTGDETYSVYAGGGYLIHGVMSGTLTISEADRVFSTEDAESSSTWTFIGSSARLRDVDEDGLDDVLLGAVSAETLYIFFASSL